MNPEEEEEEEDEKFGLVWFSLVGFYGTSTYVGY